MKKSLLIVLSLVTIQLANAQENETKIDSVVFSGRNKIIKERAEFKRHAQSTEVLSEYELNRNNSSFIEQSLGTMAGVQVDKRTQLGGQRIVVRGYGNDQKFNSWGIKSYLNSVPLTNADGVTIFEDLDFSLINQIEVVKGPAATLYGGGVGGVVRFYMRPSTEKGVRISQKLTAGSFNLFQSATRVDAVTDNSSVMFNYGHIQSDGYRPRGASLKNTYSFMGTFKINPKQELSVYANHTNSNEEVNGQISYADYYAGIDSGNRAYAEKNSGNQFDVNRATITHRWSITPNISNFTSLFYSHLDAKRISAGAAENSQNPNYGFRTTFMIKNKISDDFSNSIETGAEYLISRSLISNYRFSGDGINTTSIAGATYFKYNNNQLSFFLVDKLTYKPWELSLLAGFSGNKIEYNREDLLAYPGLVASYNKNLSFDKNFSTVYKPHIALQKAFGRHLVNLSYSEGYNAPTATTAFINGINKPNDGLKPENARMLDFSVQGLLFDTKFDYQISVFDIRVKDKLSQLSAIDPNNPNVTYTYWTNTGNQKNKGIELSLGYKHEYTNSFISRIEPFFNASYYDFRYQDFVTRLKNKETNYVHNQVVGVPRTKFALGFDFDTKVGVYLVNTFTFLGDVYTDFGNTNKVKGYHQLNSKIGYKHDFGKWNLDAYLAGNNLTNRTNYTFLFLGNNKDDVDALVGQNPNLIPATDVNPGPRKAYFFYGLTLSYKFN